MEAHTRFSRYGTSFLGVLAPVALLGAVGCKGRSVVGANVGALAVADASPGVVEREARGDVEDTEGGNAAARSGPPPLVPATSTPPVPPPRTPGARYPPFKKTALVVPVVSQR